MRQPAAITTRPPAICTAVMVSPKKARMCEPMNKDTAISTKPPTAICQASRARVRSEASAVRRRKIGAMPSGLTIGNKPTKTVRKAATSWLMNPPMGESQAVRNRWC